MIINILQGAFNNLLASDPCSSQRLAQHAGKSVGFDLLGTPLKLLAGITAQGVRVTSGSLDQANCVLRGSPIALARYLNAKNVNPSTNAALGVEIDGDLEFAGQVSKVFRQLNIDWEEIFSGITGDFTAHHINRALSSLATGFGKARRSARQNLEYVLNERLEQVVHKDEAEGFYRQVDELAADVDKLELRINTLQDSGHA